MRATDRTARAPGRWRPSLRDFGLASLIGAGIGVLLWTGDGGDAPFLPYVLTAVWIGLWIYSASTAVLALAGRWLEGLSGPALWLAMGVSFFCGGAGGFFGARATLPWGRTMISAVTGFDGTIGMHGGWGSILFAGALGVVIGAAFFRYELLQGRLEASQARLRETELAERELETARDIQRRILPPPLVEGDGFRVLSRNLPARVVAGDFYEVFRFGDGALGLAVADVSGKGIGASLVMASVKARLPLLAAERSVADTLGALNEALERETSERQFVALACLRFQPWDGAFELGNAGLPDPYLWRDGEARALPVPAPRLPLGLKTGLSYRTLEGRLETGERLLFITDGLPEALTAAGEPLGYERFERLVGAQTGVAEARLDGLLEAVRRETSAVLDDDWTAVLLERATGRTEPGNGAGAAAGDPT